MANYDHLSPADCPLVKVDWSDITEFSQWNEIEEVETTECFSVGYLLEDSVQQVVIARDYSFSDEQWAGVVAFPKKPPEVTVLCPASSST